MSGETAAGRTTAQTLTELAARVEGLAGACRETDALIRCAVFAPAGAFVRQSPINGAWCTYELNAAGKERSWEGFGLTRDQRLGSFTASIDAAMSLVPEGWRTASANEQEFEPYWTWRLARKEGSGRRFGEKSCDGFAAIAPLALTAASLRARAAMEVSRG